MATRVIIPAFALALLGCRQPPLVVDSHEPAGSPIEPLIEATAEPKTGKPVALALSDSGGCALDDKNRLWCWGGYATRHPGLRESVGEDELLVATQVAIDDQIRDFAVTNDHVCWLADRGIVQCHGKTGVERFDLGLAVGFEAWSANDDPIIVAQLDYQTTLHSNIWTEAREYAELVGFDLDGPVLCLLYADHRIVCDYVRKPHEQWGLDPWTAERNPFARVMVRGVRTTCVIEQSGRIECVPPLPAFEGKVPSRWIEGIDDAVALDLGDDHGCALRSGGVVTCFGDNGFFQRGGDGLDGVATVELPGPASAIAAAGKQSCAIVDDEILCWGATALGSGDRRREHRDLALDSTALHVSMNRSCVSRSDTTSVEAADGSATATHVWCWGSLDRNLPELLEPEPVLLPTPDIDGLVGVCSRVGVETFCPDKQWPPDRLEAFASHGDQIYCGRTRSGSRPLCGWGPDEDDLRPVANGPKSGALLVGPLGMACAFESGGLTCFDSSPEDHEAPVRSTALPKIRALTTGELGWFALDEVGQVWMFSVGRRGDSPVIITTPELVPLGGTAVEIAAFTKDPELCARDNTGAVTCIRRTVGQWEAPIRELDRGALELDAGYRHACARIDDDGDGQSESVHCWGDNSLGQLGAVAHIVRTPTPIVRR